MKKLFLFLMIVLSMDIYSLEDHHGISAEIGLTGNTSQALGIKVPSYIGIPINLNYMLILDRYLLETGFGIQAGVKSLDKNLNISLGKILATWDFSFGYLWRNPDINSNSNLYHGVSGDLYLSFLEKANDIGFGASYLLGKDRWMLSLSMGVNQNLITKDWGSYGRIGLGYWFI